MSFDDDLLSVFYGRVFENFAHSVLLHGGGFTCHRIQKDEVNMPLGILNVPPLELTRLNNVTDITNLLQGQYGMCCCCLIHCHDVTFVETGLPTSKTFAAVDAVWFDRTNNVCHCFQMTRNVDHGYKMDAVKNIVGAVKKADAAATVKLYMVVPERIYNQVRFQSYRIKGNIVAPDVDEDVRNLEQRKIMIQTQFA